MSDASVWMFKSEGCAVLPKDAPCIFPTKSDAEAYLVTYAKQHLPGVASKWREKVDRETESWGPGKRTREPEWLLDVTVEEVETLEKLVHEATDKSKENDEERRRPNETIDQYFQRRGKRIFPGETLPQLLQRIADGNAGWLSAYDYVEAHAFGVSGLVSREDLLEIPLIGMARFPISGSTMGVYHVGTTEGPLDDIAEGAMSHHALSRE